VVAEQVTDWLSRLREQKVRFACGASERYLLLEFGLNPNQGWSEIGTRGNGVPTPIF